MFVEPNFSKFEDVWFGERFSVWFGERFAVWFGERFSVWFGERFDIWFAERVDVQFGERFPPNVSKLWCFYPTELENVINTNRLNFLEEGQTIIMQVYDKINEFIIVG